MNTIKSIVVLTPAYRESVSQYLRFLKRINHVQEILLEKGIGLTYYFLNDGSFNLPPGVATLVNHRENQGLATTLVDGYTAAVELKSKPDLIIRMDVDGEHDPYKIPDIIQHMSDRTTDLINALFLPVWYWIEGKPRPHMSELMTMISEFQKSLFPLKSSKILEIYNQKFPLGFQAFRRDFLETILLDIKVGVELTEKITKKPATWGLDLLTIIIAAHEDINAIDFLWGGWATPWLENRTQEKIDNQRRKAEVMVKVAKQMIS